MWFSKWCWTNYFFVYVVISIFKFNLKKNGIQEVKNENVQMQFKINIFTYKMCFFLFLFYPNVYPKTTSHTHSIHNLFTIHKYLNIMQLHIFVFFLNKKKPKFTSLNQIFTWRSCLAASAPARVLNVTKPTGYVKKMG